MPVHGEPVGRRAINNPEVDRLGVTPLVGRHLVDGQVPDFRRGGRVNVAPLMEGPEQRIIATDVGQHAQFDLAVVGAYQFMTGRRYKRLTDELPLGRADRNVLEVGIARRQTACCRAGKIEAGVDSAGVGLICWASPSA